MFELRKLPYQTDAFGSKLSAETFSYHYNKHHNAYITNLNNLVKGTDNEKKGLLDIVLSSSGGLFNNAAQVYNHDLYWDSITPKKQNMSVELKKAIEKDFGSTDLFREAFIKAATTQFGSGWAWLVLNKEGKLEIVQTGNADTPVTKGLTPLVVIDVWEHAYYVDYRNARPKYLEELYEIINWEFASEQLVKAKDSGFESVKKYVSALHKNAN